MGSFFYLLNPKEKETIEWNIYQVFIPTTPPKSISTIVRAVFDGIYSHYCEKLINAYYGFARVKAFLLKNVFLCGDHILEKELLKGNKVIIVTAHYGGIEFLPFSLAFSGYKVAMMVRYKTYQLKQTLENLADRTGTRFIDCDEDRSFSKAIAALNEGYVLITECDESETWSHSKTQSIGILGQQIPVDRSLDILHKKTEAVILTAFVRRLENFKYVLEIGRPDDFPGTEGIQSIQGKILKAFERYVLNFPEQWYEWKKYHKMSRRDQASNIAE